MTKHILTTAALSAALLLGTANIAAYAAGITIGGGSGSVATVTGGNNSANVNLGSSGGPLATVDSNGNPVGDGSTTNANINLGSLLNGIDVGGIGGGTGGAGGAGGAGGSGAGGNGGSGVNAIFASLSSGDQTALKARCRGVLADPTIYKADVLSFCRTVIKL